MATDSENLCFICYSDFDDTNALSYSHCRHKICTSCAQELLDFKDVYFKCPFDNILSSHLISTETNESFSFDEMVEMKVSEDIDSNAKSVETSLLKNQRHVCFISRKCDLNLKVYESGMAYFDEFVNIWLRSDQKLSYSQLVKQLEEFNIELYRQMNYQSGGRGYDGLYRYLNESVSNWGCDERKDGNVKKLWRKYYKYIDLRNNLNILLEDLFDIEPRYELPQIVDVYYQNVRKEFPVPVRWKEWLLFVEDLIDFPIALLISLPFNNGELYREMNPEMFQTEEDRCLICTVVVSSEIFSTFSQCHHKVCMDCFYQYHVTEGVCPIDGLEICSLKVCDSKTTIQRPAIEYLKENIFQSMQMKLSNMFQALFRISEYTKDVLHHALKLMRFVHIIIHEGLYHGSNLSYHHSFETLCHKLIYDERNKERNYGRLARIKVDIFEKQFYNLKKDIEVDESFDDIIKRFLGDMNLMIQDMKALDVILDYFAEFIPRKASKFFFCLGELEEMAAMCSVYRVVRYPTCDEEVLKNLSQYVSTSQYIANGIKITEYLTSIAALEI